MNAESPPTQRPRVLATDLDGTLIPLPGRDENRRDLDVLREHFDSGDAVLVFVTGRHLAAIRDLLIVHQLPRPHWVIGDVGTTLYAQDAGDWREVGEYRRHLADMVVELPVADLRSALTRFDDLRLQEDHKQGDYKLSYYVDAERLDDIAARTREWVDETGAPYSFVASVDPFNGDGLLDFLPKDVSKAHALDWWRMHVGHEPHEIVFAGDSGNDLAAFESGYRSIVVGNADRRLASCVQEHHRSQGWAGRLHLPVEHATSGVLAGCRWFELLPDDSPASGDERSPMGATTLSHGRTAFRVWAPHGQRVAVCREDGTTWRELEPEGDGFFAGVAEDCPPGTRYGYRLDDGPLRPDPYSRFQPEGVHGPSEVVDPNAFAWQDVDWRGVAKAELAVYEIHVGTFTDEGTFAAAIGELDRLRELGITAIEVMPVAQTSGRWNWGYDGVNLFAPRNSYGTPDDFRAFVDACHRRGIAVILDVVYNHVGPEGNYLAEFGPYRSPRHHTPWGDALNYDGEDSGPVRAFVVDDALHWVAEYHLDGLRLDAVHFMHDDSEWTILDELRVAVTEFARTVERPIHLVAETNVFDETLATASANRAAYDLLWCDDLAHSVYSVVSPRTRLTDREYHGASDLAAVLANGHVYEGADFVRTSGGDAARSHESLLVGLQTHDLVGNEPLGRRIHEFSSADAQRAAAALVLLSPSVPLIFMGEETANEACFRFFNDFEDPRLRRAVERGRRAEYPAEAGPAPSPTDPAAYFASQLGESTDPAMSGWYRDLLAIRRTWIERGILAARNLQVEWHSSASVFVLQYQTQNEPFFVASRIPPETSGTPVSVEIEGSVLMDSSDSLSVAAVPPNAAAWALIGEGRIGLR